MALRFVDGFDHYTTLTQKWTSLISTVTITSTGTRFGTGKFLSMTSAQFNKAFDNQATWVVGFAAKFVNLPGATAEICAFRDAGTKQAALRITPAGRLEVTRDLTLLASSTFPVIAIDVWYYIEFKATIHGSTGAYEVRQNGVTVTGLSATGVNTSGSGNNYANDLWLNSAVQGVDDLYLCDGTGSAPWNSFLGDVRVDTIFPTADGSTTDFTPSTGTDNYAMVDEVTPDSDSTYVASGTLNDIDLYTFADLQSLTGTVYGVQAVVFARKDDAGTRSVAPLIKTGATTAVGSDFALSASYSYNLQMFQTNPANGGADWTISDVNNSEFGVKVTA